MTCLFILHSDYLDCWIMSHHCSIGRFGESDDDEIAEKFDDFSARNHGSAEPNAHQSAQVARPPHQPGQSLEEKQRNNV